MIFKKKLFVSDLDGTLLTSKRKLSEETIKTVKDITEKGMLFTVATGRIPGMVRLYALLLDIKIPIITCNGGCIINFSTDEIIYKQSINYDVCKDIVSKFKENEIEYAILTMESAYFSSEGSYQENFTTYNIDAKPYDMEMHLEIIGSDLSKIDGQEVMKILAFSKDSETESKMSEIVSIYDELEGEFSRANVIDITPKICNKGTGVKTLNEYLRIPMEDIVVFGDYDNDISMFEIAEKSVAVANAQEKIRNMATIITEDNDNDGVSKAINRLLGSGKNEI